MTTVAINADAADIPSVNFAQQGSDIAAPAAGRWQLFFKAGGLYARSNAGGVIGPFVTDLSGVTDAHAFHDNEDGEIAALTAKATPVDSDVLVIEDSAASNAKKKVAWSALPGAGLTSPGEGHLVLTCMGYSGSTGAGSPQFISQTSNLLSGYTRMNPANDLDELAFQAYLAAGTYTLRLIYGVSNSQGHLYIDVGGSNIGDVDAYNASNTWNHELTITGTVVATSGLKAIAVRINGKNAGSSGYGMIVNLIELWRTA